MYSWFAPAMSIAGLLFLKQSNHLSSQSMKQVLKVSFIVFICLLQSTLLRAQDITDSVQSANATDSLLRITNINPYFTLHVDSTLRYQLEINKPKDGYYWFLKNAPVGLKINKDNGTLDFRADKSFFLSGRLKYDTEYKVLIGVQNLKHPAERVDTSFTLVFYNTEIIISRVRPSVVSPLIIDEGDTVQFRIACETGSFPIETITFESNQAIKNYQTVSKCNDLFQWYVPFDFIKDNDTSKTKTVQLRFIGADKFKNHDTANVRIIVRDAINFPLKKSEYDKLSNDISQYVAQLKLTFRTLDKKIKKVRNTRLGFDMTSATSALGGTIFSSLPGESNKTTGRILPSVGVALVPMKEAAVPNRVYDQNSAALVRTSIKRLEYLLSDNALINDRDPDLLAKTTKLKNELKQVQIQLIDIPLEELSGQNAKEADTYFNSPKVNEKYRMNKKKR